MDMGNITSNAIQNCMETEELSSCVGKGTPVRIQLLDPRSPSEGIPRTPIQYVLKKSLRPDTTLQVDSTTPEDIKKRSLYSFSAFDPRSPTFAFNRTPIQVATEHDDDDESEVCDPVLLKEENFGVSADVCDQNAPVDFAVLCDPRSPSLEISRTPIQVTETKKQLGAYEIPSAKLRKGLLETDLDAEMSKRDYTSCRMKYSEDKKSKTPDRTSYLLKEKRGVTDENNCELEKENELSLKRRLFMTPDSSPVLQAGLKVRNPLGSMSNYQTPALLLKMKQSWKIEQNARAVIYDLENTPNSKHPSKSEKQTRRQEVVEWDKNSTVII